MDGARRCLSVVVPCFNLGPYLAEQVNRRSLRRRLFEKHVDVVRREAEDLFVAQEARLLALRADQADLVGRAHHLSEQRIQLEAQLEETMTELKTR